MKNADGFTKTLRQLTPLHSESSQCMQTASRPAPIRPMLCATIVWLQQASVLLRSAPIEEFNMRRYASGSKPGAIRIQTNKRNIDPHGVKGWPLVEKGSKRTKRKGWMSRKSEGEKLKKECS